MWKILATFCDDYFDVFRPSSSSSVPALLFTADTAFKSALWSSYVHPAAKSKVLCGPVSVSLYSRLPTNSLSLLNFTFLMQVVLSASLSCLYCVMFSGLRRKVSCGFIQRHMLVICTWCALFVTSQFDVIFMFPIQRFGEVC